MSAIIGNNIRYAKNRSFCRDEKYKPNNFSYGTYYMDTQIKVRCGVNSPFQMEWSLNQLICVYCRCCCCCFFSLFEVWFEKLDDLELKHTTHRMEWTISRSLKLIEKSILCVQCYKKVGCVQFRFFFQSFFSFLGSIGNCN